MDVARARRSVEDEVVQFAPLRVGNELLEGVRGHAAAPKGGRIGIDEEADGENFDAVFLCGDKELAAVHHFRKNLLRLEVEHLGHRGAEDVGIEQSDLVALGSQCHGEVGRYGALAHTALARTYGNDILDLRKHLARFGTLCLEGLHLDFHLHGFVHVGMDGSFGSLEHRLHEGVGGFFEDEGETNLHAVNAEVVLHHFGFDEVLAVARVAHGGKGVGDQFGIKGHDESICRNTIKGKAARGGGEGACVLEHGIVHHGAGTADFVAVLRDFLMGRVLAIAAQGLGIFYDEGQHGVVSHRAAANVDAHFERLDFGN